MESRVSSRGQTVIPAEIRKKAGIGTGARLWWTFNDGLVEVVVLPQDSIEGARGVLRGYDITVADLLEERRKDLELEEGSPAREVGAVVRS